MLIPAFFLVACSKHSGSAETFGGGDPTLSALRTQRQTLAASIQQIAAHGAGAYLCSGEQIAAEQSDFFQRYPAPTIAQAIACQSLLVGFASQLEQLAQDETDSPISITEEPLGVVFGGVTTDAMAATQIGRPSEIFFDAVRAQAATAFGLRMMLAHELFHQLQAKFSATQGTFIAGTGIRDQDDILDYRSSFLDYAGAAWASYGTAVSPSTGGGSGASAPRVQYLTLNQSQLTNDCWSQFSAPDNAFAAERSCNEAVAVICRNAGFTQGYVQEMFATGSVTALCVSSLRSFNASISQIDAAVGGQCAAAGFSGSLSWLACGGTAGKNICQQDGYPGGMVLVDDAGTGAEIDCAPQGTAVTTTSSGLQAAFPDLSTAPSGYEWIFYYVAASRYCRGKGYTGGLVQALPVDPAGTVSLLCY
jgi:hypothetical protein